jgi:DNA (cytosine-5)-methyltransferase 1
MINKRKFNVIDLFSGCGGLSYGFIEAGYEVLLGIDNSKEALETFKHNHKGALALNANLFTVTPKQISKETGIKKIDIIVGGPPCQGFSIAGKRIINDERNKLYLSFVDFVSYYKPKAFIMENVPNIISMGEGLVKDKIIKDFQKLGYKVSVKVLLASDYGVPQNRRRAIFVGLRTGDEFVFPEKSVLNTTSTGEAISDLPDCDIIDGSPYPIHQESKYQKLMRKNSNKLFNHQLTKHNERTIEIVSLVPDGGNYKDLPKKLQGTRKVNIAWTRLNSQRPSFTIDTGHRHHFHYKFNRVPTVRESARIQSFPDEFIFLGSKTSQYKQVGNAVPPILAKALAESLKKFL